MDGGGRGACRRLALVTRLCPGPAGIQLQCGAVRAATWVDGALPFPPPRPIRGVCMARARPVQSAQRRHDHRGGHCAAARLVPAHSDKPRTHRGGRRFAQREVEPKGRLGAGAHSRRRVLPPPRPTTLVRGWSGVPVAMSHARGASPRPRCPRGSRQGWRVRIVRGWPVASNRMATGRRQLAFLRRWRHTLVRAACVCAAALLDERASPRRSASVDSREAEEQTGLATHAPSQPRGVIDTTIIPPRCGPLLMPSDRAPARDSPHLRCRSSLQNRTHPPQPHHGGQHRPSQSQSPSPPATTACIHTARPHCHKPRPPTRHDHQDTAADTKAPP